MDPAAKIRSPSLASEPIREIDILWITAGLGCDGDTIAITAATQPSLEDILLGALLSDMRFSGWSRKNLSDLGP
jgi:hydrogenase small subunit